MNVDRLKELIDKIPISMLFMGFILYLGFQYYSFENDLDSPFVMKRKEVEALKERKVKSEQKLKEVQEFVKTLDVKRTELRQLAQQLQEVKGSLSETLDIPAFMKMTLTEAKRAGMKVNGLVPAEATGKEYYSEQAFIMSFQGVFVQLVTFLQRISNVTEIVRIDNFSLKPKGYASGRFVELEGTIEIKAYKYLGSQADTLGKEAGEKL